MKANNRTGISDCTIAILTLGEGNIIKSRKLNIKVNCSNVNNSLKSICTLKCTLITMLA